MNGFNAIVEGDYFLAIQWDSSSMSYPWRLADWMEEIRSISSMMPFSFAHVYRETNMLADAIAKDGASRTSSAFYA